MGGNESESIDFYQVLGLRKGCSDVELKNAYRKLALKWHPDRCLAFGDSKDIEEAKKKFQAIQEAYSVLSNANKRFLYDVGVYDIDDDENGMADFLSEMAVMMNQNKPTDNGEVSFEELKDLFEEMFGSDIEPSSEAGNSTLFSSCERLTSKKRGSSEMATTTTEATSGGCDDHRFPRFCMGGGRRAPEGCLQETPFNMNDGAVDAGFGLLSS